MYHFRVMFHIEKCFSYVGAIAEFWVIGGICLSGLEANFWFWYEAGLL